MLTGFTSGGAEVALPLPCARTLAGTVNIASRKTKALNEDRIR